MQGTHADFGDGGGAEGFAEAVDGFVEEDGDGFRGVVAAIEAGAAGDEYDLDVGIGYPGGDLRADVVFVVGEQGARAARWCPAAHTASSRYWPEVSSASVRVSETVRMAMFSG